MSRLIIVLGLIFLFGCSDGGNGGGIQIKTHVIMGPIVSADVQVFALNDSTNIIATGTTSDGKTLAQAGAIDIYIPEQYTDIPLYVRVFGGVDIDVDDDGNRDDTPTDNNIALEFVIPSAEALTSLNLSTKFNPLLLYASGYVIGSVTEQAEISNEEIKRTLRSVANAFIIGEDQDGDGIIDDIDGDGSPDDINTDGIIDWQDIVVFNPLDDKHKAKCRMPWEYLLDRIERQRNGYSADLELSYRKYFSFDPHIVGKSGTSNVMHPLDYDGDGEWNNEPEEGDHFSLSFSSNWQDHNLSDLIEGQGVVGGNVEFPEPIDLFYGYFGFQEGTDECDYVLENTTGHLPLTVSCDAFEEPSTDDSSFIVDVGGFIYDPESAPEGVYLVNFSAGNETHEESLYVFENSEKTTIFPIPQIFIDDQKRIDYIVFRFEDRYGNVLEDPPILGMGTNINLWARSEVVNQIVRGEGYYDDHHNAFNIGLNLVDSSEPIYPLNNGNKIYVEDMDIIYASIQTGDGVFRNIGFFWDRSYLPQLVALGSNGNTVTATYSGSSKTGKPVDRIRYRFDTTTWVEVPGETVSIEMPISATKFYVTAADDSGFFNYPPSELSAESQ